MIPSVHPSPVVDLAPPGRLLFYERFVASDVADRWLDEAHQLSWQREEIVMFGKQVEAPRRTVSFGASGATYRYSGVTHGANGWGSFDDMKSAVERAVGTDFNFVLGTHYSSGHDALGWHSDDERDLGDDPTIAVVSLGVDRDFQFRPKAGGAMKTVELAHGSLLVMRRDFQSMFRHRVPRRLRVRGDRFSFSFRRTGVVGRIDDEICRTDSPCA